MAKVIYTEDANPLSLKVRFLIIETLASNVKSHLGRRSIQPKFPEISVQSSMDRFGPTGKVSKKRVHLLRWTTFPGRTGWNFGWMDRALGHMTMYQSLPSTPLLRQLNCIIPFVDFNILLMSNFSGLIWSLFTVGSCQKRAEASFAPPSNWLMISLRVIPVRVYRDIIFPLYLSSTLYFMDGWVFKRAFFEVLFPYNDKGGNSSSKNQQQGLHVFKSYKKCLK